ncbi:unnamed protein product [Leuciscus chuanchicus]
MAAMGPKPWSAGAQLSSLRRDSSPGVVLQSQSGISMTVLVIHVVSRYLPSLFSFIVGGIQPIPSHPITSQSPQNQSIWLCLSTHFRPQFFKQADRAFVPENNLDTATTLELSDYFTGKEKGAARGRHNVLVRHGSVTAAFTNIHTLLTAMTVGARLCCSSMVIIDKKEVQGIGPKTLVGKVGWRHISELRGGDGWMWSFRESNGKVSTLEQSQHTSFKLRPGENENFPLG